MLISLLRRSGRFLRSERAVSALEYAVLAGVVIAGVGAAIVAFTGDIATSLTTLGTTIENTASSLDAGDLSPP